MNSSQAQCYCALCDAHFSTVQSRQTHISTSSEHPECQACGKKFLNQHVLRNHKDLSTAHRTQQLTLLSTSVVLENSSQTSSPTDSLIDEQSRSYVDDLKLAIHPDHEQVASPGTGFDALVAQSYRSLCSDTEAAEKSSTRAGYRNLSRSSTVDVVDTGRRSSSWINLVEGEGNQHVGTVCP
ncbi:hypothetical protein BDV98DRAFT_99204 [Pterulicium gracile]|uniref:C2H2-type domain-containing protein n=1 Tax=Pterulicium gracile TaxID=1884261 RepID=A0A5C3QRC0_9AGAR|nr:hypothetical protein BDV98DRAFT_99204 [Pterula gracilis]